MINLCQIIRPFLFVVLTHLLLHPDPMVDNIQLSFQCDLLLPQIFYLLFITYLRIAIIQFQLIILLSLLLSLTNQKQTLFFHLDEILLQLIRFSKIHFLFIINPIILFNQPIPDHPFDLLINISIIHLIHQLFS